MINFNFIPYNIKRVMASFVKAIQTRYTNQTSRDFQLAASCKTLLLLKRQKHRHLNIRKT